MEANVNFKNKSTQFWGYARLISEKMGYSAKGEIKKYDANQVIKKLKSLDIEITQDILDDVMSYLDYRSDLLNNEVQYLFMDVNLARTTFHELNKIYVENKFTCSLPWNKQSGEKKDFAYYTGIINILTESYLRAYATTEGLVYGKDISFDNDPRSLTYLKDNQNVLHGTLSRRFDGAYPSTINPKAIWEIKEYYYTTTFGSRIADGVYETQLDGFEINQLSHVAQGDIKHIYFIDAYQTWWVQGKSYLCRIIDMLHMGLVDEVIFGKEVLERWKIVLDKIIHSKTVIPN